VYRVRAVERAIDLLKAFTQEAPELSLADLASRTGLPKPTAFRILSTLRAGGLIGHNALTGAYTLGSEIAALAAIRARQSELLDRALPIMRHIRDELNETTSLAIRVGDYRVHLYQLESLHAVRRTTEIGDRAPLYYGAANRILLSAMEDSEIAAYLDRTDLVPLTPRTIVDPDKIWDEVHAIRELGYAESRGERHPGGTAVAAPIRAATGLVEAVIYVSVPDSRYTEDFRVMCIASVRAGAASISAELGYRERPIS
jgi:DNA-binding IclR family transcriptional regulator